LTAEPPRGSALRIGLLWAADALVCPLFVVDTIGVSTYEAMAKIAKALGVSIEDLIK